MSQQTIKNRKYKNIPKTLFNVNRWQLYEEIFLYILELPRQKC